MGGKFTPLFTEQWSQLDRSIERSLMYENYLEKIEKEIERVESSLQKIRNSAKDHIFLWKAWEGTAHTKIVARRIQRSLQDTVTKIAELEESDAERNQLVEEVTNCLVSR